MLETKHEEDGAPCRYSIVSSWFAARIMLTFLGLLVSDCRFLNFHNLSVSDEAIVDILMLLDGVPMNTFSLDRVTLTGEGR